MLSALYVKWQPSLYGIKNGCQISLAEFMLNHCMLLQMSLEEENTKAFLILNENYTHIKGSKSYYL